MFKQRESSGATEENDEMRSMDNEAERIGSQVRKRKGRAKIIIYTFTMHRLSLTQCTHTHTVKRGHQLLSSHEKWYEKSLSSCVRMADVIEGSPCGLG